MRRPVARSAFVVRTCKLSATSRIRLPARLTTSTRFCATAEEAKKFGLVDEVIAVRPKHTVAGGKGGADSTEA